MQTTRLPANERSPVGADFIEIEHINGDFRVIGVIQYGNTGKMGAQEFSSYQAAEDAGLKWARNQDVTHIYVVTIED